MCSLGLQLLFRRHRAELGPRHLGPHLAPASSPGQLLSLPSSSLPPTQNCSCPSQTRRCGSGTGRPWAKAAVRIGPVAPALTWGADWGSRIGATGSSSWRQPNDGRRVAPLLWHQPAAPAALGTDSVAGSGSPGFPKRNCPSPIGDTAKASLPPTQAIPHSHPAPPHKSAYFITV